MKNGMNKDKVQILEVGLRDGIQNEKKSFSVDDRIFILKKLISAGLTRIEIGSFVSPKAMPQMKSSKPLMAKVNSRMSIPKHIKLFALVPNEKGFYFALEHGLKNIAVFASATESFSQKNTNCSIRENLKRIKSVCIQARRNHVAVRGYISMAFGCPYDGRVSAVKVCSIAQQMLDEGLSEVALSDTIGIASPPQIQKTIDKVSQKISLPQLSLHCHNTRGMALPNILTALNMGIRSFDSSIGGLGGCPYAEGSSGNVATEDLVVLLQSMKMENKISVPKLVQISSWLKNKKKVKLSSYISKLKKDYSLH